MKAIIIDDENGAREVLKNLLDRTCPQVRVLDMCENVPKGVEAIKRHQPDIVFVDVEMPYYPGYELVNFFTEINFKIIFVTAYDQYAIKAFELSAVDYLLKPISRQRLIEAVVKAQEQIGNEKAKQHYDVLLESIKEQEFHKIVISEKSQKRILLLKDIIAIEAQRAYSCIYLKGNQKLIVTKPMGYFANLFPKGHRFYRTHKSWILNLDYVQLFNKNQHTVLLEDNIEAKISKLKITEFETMVF